MGYSEVCRSMGSEKHWETFILLWFFFIEKNSYLLSTLIETGRGDSLVMS